MSLEQTMQTPNAWLPEKSTATAVVPKWRKQQGTLMPVFLPLSSFPRECELLFTIPFASSKNRRKKIFSLPLPCEKPTQTTGKTGYLYAELSTVTAERLSHRQQPKKTERKIDFFLQPFQTHDLETYYSNNKPKIFHRKGQSPCISSLL